MNHRDKILDLGCGDGLDIDILRRLGYRDLTGVDISSTLLSIAKKRNPGVRFVCGRAERLPFPAQSFDVVFANSMLYHTKRFAVDEIYRVLVPGGRFCFIEMHTSWVRTLYNFITLYFPLFAKRKRAYLAEKHAIDRWNEEILLRRLADAHFSCDMLHIDGLSIVGAYKKPRGTTMLH